MKAIIINQHGDADVLTVKEIEKPVITQPDQVLVKVLAAGINPVDAKLRKGAYPINQFPAVLGCDGAGIVEATGNHVKEFKSGDEVYYFHGGFGAAQGNYVEYAVVEEKFLSRKPENIDFIQAAALPLVLLTAWESIHDRAHIQPEQSILIHAGAGGVGLVAIQLAKITGARVCTTVSTEAKAGLVKKFGADHVIHYKEEDFVDAVMEWTDGNGVDIVMDNVGGDLIEASFPAVKYYGDMVTLLQPDRNTDWTCARQRNLRFSMEIMLTPQLFGLTDAQLHQTWILDECRKLIERGLLSAEITGTYPLEEVRQAHVQIESGTTTGKIVLDIS